MVDEDRVEEIFQRILEAIKPDQGPDGFDSILLALQDAISFQMACACPICRRRLASKLRQDIPAMLVRADQICASSGAKVRCELH